MALRKDSLESTDWGRLCSTFDAAATAIAPVSSATRSLAEDTAGADAPLNGINPNAATALNGNVRCVKNSVCNFCELNHLPCYSTRCSHNSACPDLKAHSKWRLLQAYENEPNDLQ